MQQKILLQRQVNNIDVFTSAHTASSPANLAHALALVLYSGTTNCVLHTKFSLPLALAYTLALALVSLAHALHTCTAHLHCTLALQTCSAHLPGLRWTYGTACQQA